MLNIGTEINKRYKLVKLISRGGMGEVWLSNDVVLDRNVALKTVNANYIEANPKATQILKDEAKIGAKLIGHPNIVNVLDLGVFEDKKTSSSIYYIAMELVNGMTVANWINNTNLSLDSKNIYYIDLLIAWEMCKAIQFAHRNDILHRDIKPLNVFLSRYGITKVGDFGIARFVEAITRTHTVWNAMSPAYSAPEQWKGEKHNVATDIYQLGCTLYHLFTKKLPFEVSGLPAMMNSHLNEMPKKPSEISKNIPEQLSGVIMAAMNKDGTKRAEIWEINNIIANELQGHYTVKVNVSKKSKEIQDMVNKITEFNIEVLRKEEFVCDFPDFGEALSECMELILAGIEEIDITKKS
jgi:serine/threonine-protein kinase